LDDSKKLTARKREDLFHRLTGDERIRWAISFADEAEIDRVNILRATHAAMARAVAALELAVEHCLIDGLPLRSFAWPHDGIVKGDSKSMSIAAASIVAKVSRDRRML